MSIKAAPNKENYLELTDERGERMDDFEGYVRPIWKLKERSKCPFPNCSDNAYGRVKGTFFSLVGEGALLSYVKNHGIASGLHCKHPTHPADPDEIDAICQCLEIEELEDDFETSQSYKEGLQKIQDDKNERDEEEKNWKQGRKRKAQWQRDSWSEGTWGAGAQASSDDWHSAPVSPDVANMQKTVESLAAQVQTLSDAQQQTQHAPSAGTVAVPGLVNVPDWAKQQADAAAARASEWDPSMLVRVQERTITLPYSQLLLYKESLGRAREAAKSAMAALLQPLTDLQREVGVLANAEAVIDELLEKGKHV